MQSLGFKGKVDQGTADEIARLMKSSPAMANAGEQEEEHDDSNLAQYLTVVNSIIAAGSTRPYLLLLDGFIHSDECASLWKFDSRKKNIELQLTSIGGGEPSIFFYNSGVEIYIFGKLEREKLLKYNELFGANPESYPTEELDTLNKPLVRDIYEHRVGVVANTLKHVRPGRRGERWEPEVKTLDPFEIPGDHMGVKQMLSSLQPALEARARSAEALKKAIAGGTQAVEDQNVDS